MVAALAPGIIVVVYHFCSLNYIKNTTFFILPLATAKLTSKG